MAEVLCLVTFKAPVRVIRMDRAERIQAVIAKFAQGAYSWPMEREFMVRLACIETYAADSTSSTKHTVTLDVASSNIAGAQMIEGKVSGK